MTHASLPRTTAWSLRSAVRWWWFVLPGLLFLFTGWRAAQQAANLASAAGSPLTANVWDAFFIAFAGPDAWSASLLPMLAWFIPHLIFFYLVGDLAHGELVQRGHAVMPLVGSRLCWWAGKIITLLFITIGFVVWNMCIVLAGSLTRLPWSWGASELWQSGQLKPLAGDMTPPTLLWLVGVLFSSTLFATASLQLVLSLVLRHSFYGFAVISAVMLTSWLLGSGYPSLTRWLPGSQSMLLRHTFFDPKVPDFSLAWSLIYNAALTLAVIIGGAWYVRRMDIFGSVVMEAK